MQITGLYVRLRRNPAAVLLTASFCIGEITAASACISGKSEAFGEIAGIFFSSRLDGTFTETVINSFSGAFLLILLCFVLGLGAVSQPIEAAVPFFLGMGTGTVLTEMNAAYGIKGLGASVFLVLPCAVSSAFAVITAACEAVKMSCCIAGMLWGKSDARSDRPDLRLYLAKFLTLTAFTAVFSLIQGIITFLTAGLWTSLTNITN
jgi:hypothetical protein